MFRKNITTKIQWEPYGGDSTNIAGNNRITYSKDFIFDQELLKAEITVRARNKSQDRKSGKDFLNISMQRKKIPIEKYEGVYDNLGDFLFSVPIGHADTEHNQETRDLQKVFPGDAVRFEISNPGPSILYDIELIITQDILQTQEKDSRGIVGVATRRRNDDNLEFFRIDPYGYKLDAFPSNYFNNHNIYKRIIEEEIDGQKMIRIPKFYTLVDETLSSGDYIGGKAWWISEKPLPGFKIHPAFMKKGEEIDYFWVGKYEASEDGEKACSQENVFPWRPKSFPAAKTACEARNSEAVKGFHMLNIYELGALQFLCFIENGHPDVQSSIGVGNTDNPNMQNTGTTDACWRGVSEFWGNFTCFIDGIKTEDNGDQKSIFIYDEEGNETYINTEVIPLNGSGSILGMKDDFSNKFDFRKIFIAEQTISSDSSYVTFGNDSYFRPTSGDSKYWRHGGNNNSKKGAGLFSMFNDIRDIEDSFSANVGFRLAKS